jgi:2-methylisocitrate lyase-like PEP mutase family enzyme
MTPRAAFREILAGTGYTIVPGAVDPLGARLVEAAGFGAVYLTGGGFSRANGFPDIGLLTMTEIVAWIARCVEAVSIPVIADMDTGYGNALNVVRSVREYERAGVAAFHLEDQVAPKKCGHYEGKALVSPEEMVGKIKAAVDTRTDAAMAVIARTDAIAVEGFDAAIARMQAYMEAGADVGFVEAPESEQDMARIPALLPGPVLCNIFAGGKTPALPADKLAGMGYRLGIYPSQTQRAAIKAVIEVLAVLKTDGDTARIEERLATFQERESTVDTAHWRALERKYLEVE